MRFYPFQFAECFDSDYGDYLDRMENNGVWGGEMEITALSQLFCRKFKVYDDRSFDLCLEHGDSMDDQVIHLFFVNGNHYESIVHLDEAKFAKCMLKSPPGEFEEARIKALFEVEMKNSDNIK
jgi:hypothetical protein